MSDIGRYWVICRIAADDYVDRGMDFTSGWAAVRYAGRMVRSGWNTAFVLDRDSGRLLYGRGDHIDPGVVFDLDRVDASGLEWLPISA